MKSEEIMVTEQFKSMRFFDEKFCPRNNLGDFKRIRNSTIFSQKGIRNLRFTDNTYLFNGNCETMEQCVKPVQS